MKRDYAVTSAFLRGGRSAAQRSLHWYFIHTDVGLSQMAIKTLESRTRACSEDVSQSFEELRALRDYFRSDAALCRALGWRPATARDWLRGTVTRSRLDHRAQVRWLLALARKANEWVVEPNQVGDWICEPQAALTDSSPSVVVRTLGGEGLKMLLNDFVKIAPRTRLGNPPLPSANELRAALATTLDLGTRTLVERAARAPRGDVDLSDFD